MFDLLNTKARLFKAICLSVAVCFLLTGAMPSQAFAQHLGAPPAPNMVPLSPAFTPTLVRGIRVYPDNPFTFDFIVDSGDTGLTGDALTKESEKLIRYFLASLTIPENNLWVNLSPHEKDRIIPDTLGATEMGHDMLAQDYLLKQITASLTNPDSDLGKEFWSKIYKKAYEEFGTTNIPVDTFNKVWIMPDKAEVYENGDKAFVADSRLKVLLEEDYVALQRSAESRALDARGVAQAKQQVDSREHIVSSEKPLLNTNDQMLTTRNSSTSTSTLSSQIVREVFIPVLEKEVNEGKNFAQLRQIYDVIILGYWYKTKLKDSILNQAYANQQKVKGIDFSGKAQTQAIYDQYLDTFKKGVCNMMKVEYDPYVKKAIPRKYFAGGVTTADVKRVFKSGQDPSACSALINKTKIALIVLITAGMSFASYSQIPNKDAFPSSQQIDLQRPFSPSLNNKTVSPGVLNVRNPKVRQAEVNMRDLLDSNSISKDTFFRLAQALDIPVVFQEGDYVGLMDYDPMREKPFIIFLNLTKYSDTLAIIGHEYLHAMHRNYEYRSREKKDGKSDIKTRLNNDVQAIKKALSNDSAGLALLDQMITYLKNDYRSDEQGKDGKRFFLVPQEFPGIADIDAETELFAFLYAVCLNPDLVKGEGGEKFSEFINNLKNFYKKSIKGNSDLEDVLRRHFKDFNAPVPQSLLKSPQKASSSPSASSGVQIQSVENNEKYLHQILGLDAEFFPRNNRISEAELRQHLRDRNTKILIARQGEDVVGFAIYWSEDSQDPDQKKFHLSRIVVKDGLRGQGLGSQIMHQVIEDVMRQGGRTITYIPFNEDSYQWFQYYAARNKIKTTALGSLGEQLVLEASLNEQKRSEGFIDGHRSDAEREEHEEFALEGFSWIIENNSSEISQALKDVLKTLDIRADPNELLGKLKANYLYGAGVYKDVFRFMFNSDLNQQFIVKINRQKGEDLYQPGEWSLHQDLARGNPGKVSKVAGIFYVELLHGDIPERVFLSPPDPRWGIRYATLSIEEFIRGKTVGQTKNMATNNIPEENRRAAIRTLMDIFLTHNKGKISNYIGASDFHENNLVIDSSTGNAVLIDVGPPVQYQAISDYLLVVLRYFGYFGEQSSGNALDVLYEEDLTKKLPPRRNWDEILDKARRRALALTSQYWEFQGSKDLLIKEAGHNFTWDQLKRIADMIDEYLASRKEASAGSSASSSSSVSVYLSGYKEEVNFQEQDLSDIPEEEQREFYRSASEFDLLQIERFSKQTILALCRKWFDDPSITEATLSRFVKIHPASNVPLGQVRQAQNDLYDFKINIESLKMDLRDNMGLDHPPVLIVRLDSGDYLVDGLTRTYVALQKGRISLPAVVVELNEEGSRAAQKNAEQDLAKAQPVMDLSQYKIFSYEVDHDLPEYYARAYPWTRFSRELAEDAMEKIQQFDNNAAELYLEEKAKVLQALMGSGDKKRVIESLNALDASRTGRVIEISQEALQVITRTLTASRDRQSYAAQLEEINRHWGSASSHGNRSSIFYKIASLYYDYGQYEKAIDAAETAIRVGAEPGHDNFPTRLLIQAQDLIRSAKSYIQSEKNISLQIGDLVIKAKGTASPLGTSGLSSSAIVKPTIDEFRQVLEEIKKKGFLNRSKEFLSRLQDLDPGDVSKHWSEEGAENLGSDLYTFAREIRQALDSNPAGRFFYNTLNVGGPFSEKLDVINPLSGVSMTLRSPDKGFVLENFDTLQASLEKVRDVFEALEKNEYTLADVKFWNEENGFYLDIFHQGPDLLQGQAGVGNSPLLAKKIESLKQWEPAWIFGSGRSEYKLVAEQQELDDNAWELWLEDSQTGKRARACAFTLFGLPNGKVLFYDFSLTEGDLVWEDKQRPPDDEFSKMQKLLEAISPSADARVEHLKDLSLMDQLYYWLKKRGIIEQEDILEKSIEVQKTREFDRKIYLDEELNAFSFTDGDIRYLVPAAGADEHTIKALMGDKDKIISANELARFFAFGSLEGGEGFDVRLTFQQMLDFEDERYPGYYQEYYIDGLSALYMYYFDNSKEARQVDPLGEIQGGNFKPGSPSYERMQVQKKYFAQYAKSRIEDTRPSDGGQNILSLLDGQLLFTPLFVTEIRLSDSAPGEGRDPFKDAREIAKPGIVTIADSPTSTANKRFYSQIKEKLDGQIIVDPDGSQNYKVFVQTDLKKVNQNDPIVDVEVHLIDEQGKKSVSPVFAFQILSPGQIRQFESFLLGVSFTEQDRAALKDVTIEDLDQIFEEMLDKIDNGIPLSYGDLSGGIVERQFFRYLASALETGNGVIEGDYAQYQIIDDQLWGQPFFYDQASGFYKKQRDDGPGYDFIIASESQRVMAEVFKEPQDRIITFQQLASLLVFKDLYFAERSGMAIQLSWLIDQGFPGSMEDPAYLEEIPPIPMEEATGIGIIAELIKYRAWTQEMGITRNDDGEFTPKWMDEKDLGQMLWELPSPRLRFTIQASSSTLSSGNAQGVDQLGGIDFNAENMNIEIQNSRVKSQNDNPSSPLSLYPSIPLDLDSIEGLAPVILNVVPVVDFMGLLGLSPEDREALKELSKDDTADDRDEPSRQPLRSEIAFNL